MGKSHGCHPNHEKALAQMRALYSAEGKSFDLFGEDESLKVLTQKRGKESRPASQFLVVGDKDKPDTWNLPTHQGSKLSPRLLGAAHAALTVGYRGQKYSGPGKEEAILKLKRLYRKAGLQWPESKEESTKKSIALYELEQKVRDAIREKIMDVTVCEELDVPWFNIDTYTDFALAHAPAGLYQIQYSVDAETYEVTLGEPNKVKIEYIPDGDEDEGEGEDKDM